MNPMALPSRPTLITAASPNLRVSGPVSMPCITAAIRSSPAPVSTEGLGSGVSVPSSALRCTPRIS